MAYECSQTRSRIRATAAGLHHSHSNVGYEPHLWPTLQLTATPYPKPTEWGQDWTCVLIDTSRTHCCCTTTGTPKRLLTLPSKPQLSLPSYPLSCETSLEEGGPYEVRYVVLLGVVLFSPLGQTRKCELYIHTLGLHSIRWSSCICMRKWTHLSHNSVWCIRNIRYMLDVLGVFYLDQDPCTQVIRISDSHFTLSLTRTLTHTPAVLPSQECLLRGWPLPPAGPQGGPSHRCECRWKFMC